MPDDVEVYGEVKPVETPVPEQPKPAEAEAKPVPEAQETETVEAQTEGEGAEAQEGQAEAKKGFELPVGAKKRIDTLTKNWKTTERERDALRIELEALRAAQGKPEGSEEGQSGQTPAQGIPTREQLDQLINQRAEQMVAQRNYQSSLNTMTEKGNAEFKDFTERCNLLADLGAGENPNFMTAVAALPDGHKVIAELADNPDEVSRILTLPPVQMGIELAKFSSKPAPKKPISSAPKPITPITATAKPSEELTSDLQDDKWFALRMKQRNEKGWKGARH